MTFSRPLSTRIYFFILDETGPIFYLNPDAKAKEKYVSAHILIGVELVTYRVNLVVINDMGIISVVKGLDIIQNMRGTLLNLILDHHKSYMALTRDQTNDRQSDLTKLIPGNPGLLGGCGIRVTISLGKSLQKV